jgi:hypothetical protein
LPENLRPTFARYTGQEDQDERERIREAKPDILLTNFMMLELLMTRQNKLDQLPSATRLSGWSSGRSPCACGHIDHSPLFVLPPLQDLHRFFRELRKGSAFSEP